MSNESYEYEKKTKIDKYFITNITWDLYNTHTGDSYDPIYISENTDWRKKIVFVVMPIKW